MWINKLGTIVSDEDMYTFRKIKELYKKMNKNPIRLSNSLYRMGQVSTPQEGKEVVAQFERILEMDIM